MFYDAFYDTKIFIAEPESFKIFIVLWEQDCHAVFWHATILTPYLPIRRKLWGNRGDLAAGGRKVGCPPVPAQAQRKDCLLKAIRIIQKVIYRCEWLTNTEQQPYRPTTAPLQTQRYAPVTELLRFTPRYILARTTYAVPASQCLPIC